MKTLLLKRGKRPSPSDFNSWQCDASLSVVIVHPELHGKPEKQKKKRKESALQR